MTAIQPLWGAAMPLSELHGGGHTEAGASFTDIFETAVNAVKETDAEKVEMQQLMATGQLDNPAPLLIASSKALLSVNFLVQLRNKAMDAYSELTRISL